jgi:cytidyltransferase-like protein
MKTIAVYPGRFQPFHKGHAQVYKWLKSKFGNATIATSNKVEAPKSPFNFKEKKKMMELAGVASSDIHEVRNPYIASEILKGYDGSKTVVVFAVSQKDMDEDPRFSFKPTKSGKPSYLQPYPKDGKGVQPFGDPDKPRAYVVVTPTFDFEVLGEPARSATEVRKQFASANRETQIKIIKDLFGKYDKGIHKVMDEKIKGALASAPKPKSVKAIRAKLKEEEEGPGDYYRNNPPPDSPVTRAASNLPVISQAKAAVSAIDNVKKGNYGAALADVAGEIPKVGMAVGAARAAGVMKEDKVDDIGKLDHEKFGPMLDSFTQFASGKLGIKKAPKINLSKDEMSSSFGGYNPADQSIVVVSKNRHPMDIFRTVAHELVHHKQKEDDRIGKDISYEGSTGSPFENEANAEAGKIMRWFAKKNPEVFKSGYVVEETLTEGINDPGTFKAIFLAGGPGSGKDYVMKQTLAGMGLQEINSDIAFEFLMKKAGLDFKMPETERVERDVVRGRGKNISKEQQRLAIAGRRGIIINGTADDPEKIAMQKKEFEELGYDTMMVFVNTSDKVSKERNIARGDEGGRTVPEDIRKDKWDACQAAMPVLKKLFGEDNFVAIDNSNDLRKASPEIVKKVQGQFQEIFKMAKKFVARQPINNKKAADWQQSELQRRNMQSFTPAKATAFGSGAVQRGAMQTIPLPPDQDATQQISQAPTPEQMSQGQRLGLSYYGFGRWGTTIKGKHTVTYLTQNGKLVPKPQQVAEEKKMKGPDPCWKGYQMVGKKKKNGKEVPNCVPVDEAFATFAEGEDRANTYKRELGTKDLADLYAKDTPGQDTTHLNPLYEKKKVRLVKKKKVQEDSPPALGYEFGNPGIGPTFGVVRSPGGLGMGYSLPLNESIKNWMLNEKTIERFIEKYGELAEEKLIETANKLDKLYTNNSENPKSFTEIRESWDAAGGRDMGTVPKTGKQDMDESTPAWQRKEGKNPAGGLNKKGIDSYRKEHPGSKLSLAVTTKPSKLKPGSKKAKRRLSFCRRMKGMKSKLTSAKTAHDPNSRINKSLRKWNCEE